MRWTNGFWKWFLLITAVAVICVFGIFFSLTSKIDFPLKKGNEAVPFAITVDCKERDFGIVFQEVGRLSHKYIVSNDGPKPIYLQVVYVGCSCLKVDCPALIPPFLSESVTVELEIGRREGPVSTYVKIATSDPQVSEIELELKCFVKPKIKIDPPFVRFSDVCRGEFLKQELQVITCMEKEPKNLLWFPQLVASSEAIKCFHFDSKVVDTTSARIKHTIHHFQLQVDTSAWPETKATSRIYDTIKGKMTSTDMTFEIPLEIIFRHHKWLRGPEYLTLEEGKEDREYRFRIWARDSSAFFCIAKVETSIPELSTVVVCNSPDKMQEIIVKVRGNLNASRQRSRNGFFEVYTTSFPEEPYRVEVLLLKSTAQNNSRYFARNIC